MKNDDLNEKIKSLEKQIEIMESRRFNFGKLLENNRSIIRFFTIGFLMAGLVAYSALTLPHTFQAGQTISASQVNANFQALANASLPIAELSMGTSPVYDISTNTSTYNGSGYTNYSNDYVPLNFDGISLSTGSSLTSAGGFKVFKVSESSWYEVYGSFVPIISGATYMELHYSYTISLYKAKLDENNVLESVTSIASCPSYLDSYDYDGDTTLAGNTESGSNCYGINKKIYLAADEVVLFKITTWIKDYDADPGSGISFSFDTTNSKAKILKM